MDTSKLSPGQMVAGVGGGVLIISLFLDWITGATAWDLFSAMDIIMLLVGLAALAYAAATAMSAATNLPRNTAWIVFVLAVGVTGFALSVVLETPDAGIGAWIGFVAALAIAYGSHEATRAPVGAARTRTPVATPPGTGAGTPPGTGAV